ncbi:MAG TPA: glycoside hydrolase family 97 N-terminal domain-containing protein [Kiritimatiellia bacterium]|nr:glycoside hydrolase family 97 N-terminal domain-containing protein [Kiritimatiellia bacterium]HRU69975.1 glycoside hydrolase family 97 N-terminal domain-containing protein [Kiritimatiellia bacterium]
MAFQLIAIETVVSPDGTLEARVELRDGQPLLALAYRGTTVLEPSPLGVTLKPSFAGGFERAGQTRDSVDTAWTPVWGERAPIPDRYRSLTLTLKERGPLARPLVLEFRAYNEGLALRYRLSGADGALWQLEREDTAFRFPTGSAAFAIPWTEDTFPQDPIPVTALTKNAMMPFTVRLAGGAYASVLEAAVIHYPRAMLSKREGSAVGITLLGKAEGAADAATPWRVVLVGDNEARLIEHAHLVQTLNPPCALSDTAWIQPGLTISDHYNCLLQMNDLKRVIDVAHTNGFRYLQLDWGWYGTEWTWTDADRKKFLEVNPSWTNDLGWVTNTYANPYTVAKGRVPYRPDWKSHTVVDFDMQELVRYARERGMGLCLYMHGDVLRAHDLDQLFATYAAWGIAGLKPGFVRYGSAGQTDWIRSLVAAAARHKLWLCIHDAHVPDGMERTYPNLMINEGGGGQEGNHPVRQDVLLPFTRCLAGPFDYTPHIYHKGKSHAHGIAFFVVYPGPTAVVRGGVKEFATTGPNRIGPEAEFLRRVPMNWDETRVLDAKIGHHIVTARRRGDVWYIGGMTGDSAYTAPVVLDFLAAGLRYTATIFRDGDTETDGFRPAVKETRTVLRGDRLDLHMARSGGLAVIVE